MWQSRSRVLRGVLAVVLAAGMVLATVPALAAADTRAGGTIVVGQGETVDGLTAAGGTVLVRGTVDGDLRVAAGNVLVTGTVTGDLDGAVGDLTIDGRVGGDVSVAAGNVVVREGAQIGGGLRASAGVVVVDGAVDGSVEVDADTLRLGSAARIGGDLRYDAQLQQAAGAQVAGEVRQVDGLTVVPFTDEAFPGLLFAVYWFLVNLALGAVLLVVFPRFSRTVADWAEAQPLRAGGVGLLWLFAVPVFLSILAVTVVGIPLALLGFVLYLLSFWVGSIYGRYAVGAWLTATFDGSNRWVDLLVGFVVVFVAARIPVLGGLVEVAVFLLGLGAMVTTLGLRARRRVGIGSQRASTGPA
ncbi:cell shape determination protein CcmA [Halobacteriales archaeon QS_1_68_20]|nr:MAG: cell shape determination protein CcmA [Halobacteriales archaeon QS_1_68_20]